MYKKKPNQNLWKYALIIPSLVTFVILFQVKVVAQERQNAKSVRI
jgi:hypothetical protein